MFAALFPPNPVRHGVLTGQGAGGQKKSVTVQAPVTERLLESHLRGEGRLLGYLPGSQAGTTVGAFDLDAKDYTGSDIRDAVKAVVKAGATHGLNLYREQSHSGQGWHIWVFSDHEVPYLVMRQALLTLAREAELPASTELFPKGDSVSSNWLYLPYFGGKNGPGRMFLLDDGGQPIALEELIQHVQRSDSSVLTRLAEKSKKQAPTPHSQPLSKRADRRISVAAQLYQVALQRQPSQRHDAAVAFLNLAHRVGEMPSMITKLKSRELHKAWFADGSRTLVEWGAEIARWRDAVTERAGEGRGLPYLLECGFVVPSELQQQLSAQRTDQQPHKGKEEAPQLAARLLNYLKAEDAEFWHDAGQNAFVTLKRRRSTEAIHLEHYAVRSRELSNHLTRLLYEQEGRGLSAAVRTDVVALLQALALTGGACHQTAIRVGHDPERHRTYIDLGTPDWSVVEVTPTGWKVIPSEQCPLRMLRSSAMRTLPLPEPGGSLHDLRLFISTDDRGFMMIVAWLLGAVSGRPPYPLLVLSGEQGTGKSTVATALRSLVDPSRTARRHAPRDASEVFLAARYTHILSYDNLSGLHNWLSEALCLLSTGGAFTKRALFTDDDELVFEAQRPVILNGIPDLLARPDLAERSLAVLLQRIAPDQRRSEETFWAEFEAARPRLFGALLSLLAYALTRLPDTRPHRLPRMADFARLVVASEEIAPWDGPAFLDEYQSMLNDTAGTVLESSVLADALRTLLDGCQQWRGTVKGLLHTLNEQEAAQGQQGRRSSDREWPSTPKQLGTLLRRFAPALEDLGYSVQRDGRTSSGERYALSKKVE